MASVVCRLLCDQVLSWREQQFETFFLWDKLMKPNIQTCYCIIAVLAVHCCPVGKMFTIITTFFNPEDHDFSS